mgnify:FL=1
MDVIYKKAGNIELVRYRDGKRFLKAGVVQSISFISTISHSTIANGNASFDDIFKTGMSARIEISLNSFQQKLYSALTDIKDIDPINIDAYILSIAGLMPIVQIADLGTMRVIDESGVCPEEPHSITLSRTPISPSDIVVYDENNEPYTYTENSPGEREFMVSGRELYFNTAAVGKEFVVAYDATGVNISKMQMVDRMSNDIFSLTITGESFLAKNDGVVRFDAIYFDRVMPVGEISQPVRQKEPQSWRFALQVLKPRQGMRAIDFAIQV